MSRFPLSAMTTTAALALIVAPPAEARTRRHHRTVMRAEPDLKAAPAQPQMFYPQDIEGGVLGNLPFNNQIRKHTDPLNANGGR